MSRTATLSRESVAIARAYRGASIATASVAAVVCLLVFLTAGRAAASERQILASIDDAGVRLITVTVQQGYTGMDPGVVDRIDALSGVQWAVGLGQPHDVHNTAIPGGTNASARTVYGDWTTVLHLDTGQAPRPGQAVASATTLATLGMTSPSGGVTDGQVSAAMVGTISATGPAAGLADYVLVHTWADAAGRNNPPPERLTLAYVAATSPEAVPGLIPAIRALTGIEDPAGVAVDSSTDLIAVQRVISGNFGELSRQLALAALGAGTLVIALTMVMSVISRRRDYGRRRALGATRSTLVILVLAQAAIPTLIGVAVGTLGGALLVTRTVGTPPTLSTIVAVPTLTLLAAALAALPAAVLAARRDPVRILRVA